MTGAPSMRLRVVTPGQVALDTNVDKVSAEATTARRSRGGTRNEATGKFS